MHENEYAYAVARIRANEVNLLTPAETEQLISAESYEAALRLLGDKGWHTDGVGHDYAPMLEEHVNAAWQLLKESAPDASLLDALVINNDFFNLKAALKAKIPPRIMTKSIALFPAVTKKPLRSLKPMKRKSRRNRT